MAAFFASDRVVDLYTDVVARHTEWPTNSYGIKPLAKFCEFSWAAEDASCANSIAWYYDYRETGNPRIRDRIVDYNRSDCIASAVVLDALIAMPVGGSPDWPPPARATSGGEGHGARLRLDGEGEGARDGARERGPWHADFPAQRPPSSAWQQGQRVRCAAERVPAVDGSRPRGLHARAGRGVPRLRAQEPVSPADQVRSDNPPEPN